jgi:uncharacterized membrane protein
VIFVTDRLALYAYPDCSSNLIQGAKMKLNVGSTDQILRIVVGLALIGATLAGLIGVWGWIGVVPLLTGIFKFCPAYTLLGMNTCPMEKK